MGKTHQILKPLPERVLTQIYVKIWHHQAPVSKSLEICKFLDISSAISTQIILHIIQTFYHKYYNG